MEDFLKNLGGFMAVAGIMGFFIGIILLIASKDKKMAAKFILGSVIITIIGFGTCASNFNLGNMN